MAAGSIRAEENFPGRAFFDLSSRIKLRVTGADHVRFLNGQITNDLRKANASTALEACVLNAKGKMDAHIFIHLDSDSFILDADPELENSLQTRLERYVIADDVQFEDITSKWSIFHLIDQVPAKLNETVRVIAVNRFGFDGRDVWFASAEYAKIMTALVADFVFYDATQTETFRIEQGIPRWGRELTPEIIPLEANLEERCVDYGKGCYIGQETISRMKMSGQRNKQLCGLVSTSGSALASGMRLIAGEKDAGWITSATDSHRLQRQVGLGFVRRGFNAPGTELTANRPEDAATAAPVRVVNLPFSPE